MKDLKICLQLFSIKDDMNNDFEGTLQKVKDAGYDYVELCGNYGRTAEVVNEVLNRIGLKAVSIHQGHWDYTQNKQEVLDFIKGVGFEYCVLPYFSKDSYEKDFDGSIEAIKEFAQSIKNIGAKFYYHNHSIELEQVDNETLFDKIFKLFSPEEMNPQIDVAFFLPIEIDPADFIRKYAGRVELVHLKDAVMITDENGNPKMSSVPVGMGKLDIKSILSACEDSGTEYIIVEQTARPGTNPLDEVKLSRDYLKSLGL